MRMQMSKSWIKILNKWSQLKLLNSLNAEMWKARIPMTSARTKIQSNPKKAEMSMESVIQIYLLVLHKTMWLKILWKKKCHLRTMHPYQHGNRRLSMPKKPMKNRNRTKKRSSTISWPSQSTNPATMNNFQNSSKKTCITVLCCSRTRCEATSTYSTIWLTRVTSATPTKTT